MTDIVAVGMFLFLIHMLMFVFGFWVGSEYMADQWKKQINRDSEFQRSLF